MLRIILTIVLFSVVLGAPPKFETKKFKVGIEYDHSMPMYGGSDRYRHRHNLEPFFVTVTAAAKKGYVISYLEVTATVDEGGDVEFNMLIGKTGSRTMKFQLISTQSEFLTYNYLAYGIKEEEYKKISNIISLPVNYGETIRINILTCLLFITLYPFTALL